jgi:hypothetical protein
MVTGFLEVRLTPYMGAIVVNVVLHSLEGIWLLGLQPWGFCALDSMALTVFFSDDEDFIIFSLLSVFFFFVFFPLDIFRPLKSSSEKEYKLKIYLE